MEFQDDKNSNGPKRNLDKKRAERNLLIFVNGNKSYGLGLVAS